MTSSGWQASLNISQGNQSNVDSGIRIPAGFAHLAVAQVLVSGGTSSATVTLSISNPGDLATVSTTVTAASGQANTGVLLLPIFGAGSSISYSTSVSGNGSYTISVGIM